MRGLGCELGQVLAVEGKWARRVVAVAVEGPRALGGAALKGGLCVECVPQAAPSARPEGSVGHWGAPRRSSPRSRVGGAWAAAPWGLEICGKTVREILERLIQEGHGKITGDPPSLRDSEPLFSRARKYSGDGGMLRSPGVRIS